MERVTKEGGYPPLPRNATRISASPAMPRRSSRANGVVDFRLTSGRSSETCSMGALLCKNASALRKPNGRAKGHPDTKRALTLLWPHRSVPAPESHAVETAFTGGDSLWSRS
jgi:hypothetical protein